VTILNILAEIGGLLNFLLVVIGAILLPTQLFFMESDLVSRIFLENR
jgi:hypothetical protein